VIKDCLTHQELKRKQTLKHANIDRADPLKQDLVTLLHEQPRNIDFLICGAQKAGTTALSAYLDMHPDISLPQRKELHFFDNESIQWGENINIIRKRYHSLFIDTKEGLRGEATPIYMYWQPCAERIWRYNQNIKLIAILRNPVTRAYSHWNMETARGCETRKFTIAIRAEQKQLEADRLYQHRTYSYIGRGFYCQQILRLKKWFPIESLLFIKQDDLLSTPAVALSMIYTHIGVSHHPFEVPLTRHVGQYSEPIPEEARTLLENLFRAEIRSLEGLLGWDCSSWFET
jgi:hypothetical protein